MQKDDIVYTGKPFVSCSGGENPADHPLVYLEIDILKKSIDCPYCGRIFKMKE